MESIKKINSKKAFEIIETGHPKGKFYMKDNGVYVGIDSAFEDCYVEEFKTKARCWAWLVGMGVVVEGD